MKEKIEKFFDMIKSKNFRYHFILYSLIFISSIIISTIIGIKYINLSDYTIYFVKNYTLLRYGNSGMVSILANNFIFSLSQMFIFYFLEMDKFKKFLGIFYFLYTGTIAGLIISKAIIKYNLVIAVSMVLPHGIIEIPAIIFAISSGWALSENSNGKSKIMLVYISLILFLLLGIAAFIEAYITPNIFKILISYYHL